uniref:Uncharacterized protein n=1 Tax=Rhizophora mucronata TaxID=61149 RepID=A0A2P2QL88_RHIMU
MIHPCAVGSSSLYENVGSARNLTCLRLQWTRPSPLLRRMKPHSPEIPQQ